MFKNSKISNIVIMGLLCGIFLPIIITFVFFTNSYKERSSQTINIITQTISISATEALWFFSDEWIQIVINSAIKNEKIYSATIYNNENLILASKKSESERDNIFKVSTLLTKNQEVLGKLLLEFNMNEINKDIYIEKENLLWTLFLQAIISSLILYFIIKYKVLDPIKRLIKQSKLVSSKKFDQRFRWRQKDEIGELGKAMEKTRISLKKIFLQLEAKVIFDNLTKIYNRHGFEQIFKKELMRCNRYKRPISMIMYDIDFFKNVNDTYGHLTGDKVLVEISILIQENIRKSDYLIRWGGEEFFILTPESDLNDALQLAEKLKSVVENHLFEEVGQLTISLSVAQKESLESDQDFIKRIDKLLYHSKNSGRNMVSY